MKASVFCIILSLLATHHAYATDSIRCKDGMVRVGDSVSTVVRHCGHPQSADKSVGSHGTREELLYNQGEGDFIYQLTFENGRLRAIEEKERGYSVRSQAYYPPTTTPSQQGTTSSSSTGPDVKVIEWVAEQQNQYIVVKGTVKNMGKQTAKWVKIKVRALDQTNRLITIEEVYASRAEAIPAGETSFFEAMINYDPSVTKYDLSVQWHPPK